MIIDGEKYACTACIRGHRVSSCNHTNRPLNFVNKKGRPLSQCQHCRRLRKARTSHVKCECGANHANAITSSQPPSPSLSASSRGSPSKRGSPAGSRSSHHEKCACDMTHRCVCAAKRDLKREGSSSQPSRAQRADPSPQPESQQYGMFPSPSTQVDHGLCHASHASMGSAHEIGQSGMAHVQQMYNFAGIPASGDATGPAMAFYPPSTNGAVDFPMMVHEGIPYTAASLPNSYPAMVSAGPVGDDTYHSQPQPHSHFSPSFNIPEGSWNAFAGSIPSSSHSSWQPGLSPYDSAGVVDSPSIGVSSPSTSTIHGGFDYSRLTANAWNNYIETNNGSGMPFMSDTNRAVTPTPSQHEVTSTYLAFLDNLSSYYENQYYPTTLVTDPMQSNYTALPSSSTLPPTLPHTPNMMAIPPNSTPVSTLAEQFGFASLNATQDMDAFSLPNTANNEWLQNHHHHTTSPDRQHQHQHPRSL